MNKLYDHLIKWPTAYITSIELEILIDHSPDACQAVVYRAVQAGYLTRLKRGLYCITQKIRSDVPDTREIAQAIYGPSYISFEAALSFHGWIPEGVTVVTCACSKRGKEFDTPLAPFSYERILEEVFSIGVKFYETDTGSFLMAEPWKAIADLIYSRRLSWPSTAHITKDLRIENEDLKSSDLVLLRELSRHHPSLGSSSFFHVLAVRSSVNFSRRI